MKSTKKITKPIFDKLSISLRTAMEEKRFPDALNIVNEIIKYQDDEVGRATNFSSIWSLKGQIQEKLGQSEEALSSYFTALSTKNVHLISFYVVYLSIAEIYAELDNKAEAFSYYKKAIEAFKKGDISFLYKAYEGKAKLHETVFEFQEAVKAYKELIKIKIQQGAETSKTDLAQTFMSLGNLYFRESYHLYRKKEYEKSLSSIEESIKLYNYVSKSYKDFFDKAMLIHATEVKAMVLTEISRVPDALACLNNAVELYPSLELYKRIALIKFNELIRTRGESKEDIERSILASEELIKWYINLEESGFLVDPTNNKAILKFDIGIFHTTLKNYESASQAYRESMSMGFDQVKCKIPLYKVLADLSEVNLEKGNCLEALKYIEEAYETLIELSDLGIPINKVDVNSILFIKGSINLQLQRYKEALECFQQIPEEGNIQLIETLKSMSLCFMRLDEFEKVLNCCNKLIKLDPENRIIYTITKSYMLEELKQYQEALDCVNSVISESPFDQKALCSKANILLSLGEYKEAEFLVNQCTENKDDAPIISLIKSKIEFKKGNFKGSVELADRAIELGIKDSETYNHKGSALFNLGNYEHALESFKEGLAISNGIANNLYSLYVNMVGCFIKLERYSDAIELSNEAIKINPVSMDAYYNLAISYCLSGLYNEAIACFDRLNFEEIFSHITKNKEHRAKYSHISKDSFGGLKLHELAAETVLEVKTNSIEEEKSESKLAEAPHIKDIIPAIKPALEYSDKFLLKTLEPVEEIVYIPITELKKHTKKLLESPIVTEEEKSSIRKIILNYFSSIGNILEQDIIDNSFTELLTSKPYLKGFIIDLFTTKHDEEGKTILADILSSNSSFLEELSYHPKFIQQFWYKQKIHIKTEIEIIRHEVEIDKPKSLDGVHKILTNKAFKGNWFFKFSKDILENSLFSEMLEKVKPSIDSLKILSADSKNQTGFKENIISLKGGKAFPMIRLKILDNDLQIYSDKVITCSDPILNKTFILSVLGNFASHEEMTKIINGNNEYFEKTEIATEEFYSHILGSESYISSEFIDGL